MKQRIEFIDLAKGICMLMVVLLHVYGDTSGEIIKIMGYFKLPLFFVLSGMFFKENDGIFSFLKDKINKLIVPFLSSFLIVVLPTTFILNEMKGYNITFCNLIFADKGCLNLGINGTLWFLICLFGVNIIFYIT